MMKRLQDLKRDDTNTTYSAWIFDRYSNTWTQYYYRGKYRFFWEGSLHDVLTCLDENHPGEYRIYRHDTTRTL